MAKKDGSGHYKTVNEAIKNMPIQSDIFVNCHPCKSQSSPKDEVDCSSNDAVPKELSPTLLIYRGCIA